MIETTRRPRHPPAHPLLACIANLVVKESSSETTEAAALVYWRSTFCSAMPRYCPRVAQGGLRAGVRMRRAARAAAAWGGARHPPALPSTRGVRSQAPL